MPNIARKGFQGALTIAQISPGTSYNPRNKKTPSERGYNYIEGSFSFRDPVILLFIFDFTSLTYLTFVISYLSIVMSISASI